MGYRSILVGRVKRLTSRASANMLAEKKNPRSKWEADERMKHHERGPFGYLA